VGDPKTVPLRSSLSRPDHMGKIGVEWLPGEALIAGHTAALPTGESEGRSSVGAVCRRSEPCGV
jgi:hypothetical protein